MQLGQASDDGVDALHALVDKQVQNWKKNDWLVGDLVIASIR